MLYSRQYIFDVHDIQISCPPPPSLVLLLWFISKIGLLAYPFSFFLVFFFRAVPFYNNKKNYTSQVLDIAYSTDLAKWDKLFQWG